MEGFPSPFGSLKAILWDWSYFSVGLISLYAIPKNCAVIHFFGIAWSDFQSSRFVTWPICYSLLIKKKFLRGESNPSPLDKTCMLYQLSYWGMVEMSALKLKHKTKQIFFLDIFAYSEARQVCQANVLTGFFLPNFFYANFFFCQFFSANLFIVSFLAKPIFIYGWFFSANFFPAKYFFEYLDFAIWVFLWLIMQ